VHEVLPPAALHARAAELAARLAGGAGAAMARTKALLNESLLPDLEKVLERERDAIVDQCAGEEFRARLGAFIAAQAQRA
jgi:enoyl-CoA hydratase/carnithine racemase